MLLAAWPALADEDNQTLPLGPIGGTGRLFSGQNFVRVLSVTAGAPGAAAGLQVNDYIHGAFGEEFGRTGSSGITGAEQDLGLAIERAEANGGVLPLKVLRVGVGDLVLPVILPAAGGFGPAYPLGSSKFDAMFNQSCQRIHEKVQAGSVDVYLHSWGGLALLGHPNWNDTNGAKPYRNSINKIRDAAMTRLGTNAIYAPVEDKLLDGSANTNYVGSGLETWGLGSAAMFLAEYRAKSGDTNADWVLQRTAELLANRVQWWKQPALGTSYSPEGSQIAGMVSHGGVTGDYIHLGWGGGINIVGVHLFSGLALAKRAGANMSARPRDGHYFGFPTAPVGAVAAGMENYDHTLDEKFNMCWEWMVGPCGGWSAGDFGDGHICYTTQGWSTYDAAGRTAGGLFGFLSYMNGASLSATNTDRVNRIKGYLVRNYARLQECHAYTHGGQVFYQLCLPYLDDRGQRYVLENWRAYYNLARKPDGTIAWVPGRNMTDAYVDLEFNGQVYAALPGTVAPGGLPHVPAYQTNRILPNFKSPWLAWPALAARYARLTNAVQSFDVDICDGLGNVLAPASYSASWTHVSGPGTVSFGSPGAAATTMTFPYAGKYRVQLAASKGTNTLTELIDLDVLPAPAPPSFVMGEINYAVYTGISGGNVANLTNAAKFPHQPDAVGWLTSLQGTYSGSTYGQRLWGFIVPQTSGSYRFYISSDDASQFRFNSTGTNTDAATMVASVPEGGSTTQYQWTKYAGQTSPAFSLTAGQPYYFEVLHKENSGSDHVEVGWTGPGLSGTNVISSVFLARPRETAPTIYRQPVDQFVGLGDTATFSVLALGSQPMLYQWRLNGIPYWMADPTNVLTLADVGGGMAGNYDCVITSAGGAVTSVVARLVVTNTGALVAGGLWRDVFTGISGGSVSSLTNAAAFPRISDASGVVTNAEGTADYADSFGERWTGWVKPAETASYRFILTSDDASELWLSTTEHPAQKTRIANIGSYTGQRDWPNGSKSSYFTLEAGKRYYVEVLHKDDGGADHCAFTWQKQGDTTPTNGAPALGGEFLEYLTGGAYGDYALPVLTRLSPASDDVNVPAGVGVLIDASVTNTANPGSVVYQWTQLSGPDLAAFDATNTATAAIRFPTNGTYVFRCTPSLGTWNSFFDVTVNSGVLGNPWNAQSIGTVPTNVTYGLTNGVFTITGGGAGIPSAGTPDNFYFLNQPVAGDIEITARIVSVENVAGSDSRAGVMIRENSAANARHVFMGLNSLSSGRFIWRTTAGANSANTSATLAQPYWVRLRRAADAFTAFAAPDAGGAPGTWTQIGAVLTNAMSANTLVGLAAGSGSATLTNRAVIDNVSYSRTLVNIGATVSAGPNQSVADKTALVAGAISDDGLPNPPSAVAPTWLLVSGPGAAVFATSNSLNTSVQFASYGFHTLRLVTDDGEVRTFSDTTVTAGSGLVPTNLTLVATNAAWRYHDKGLDLGTAWRATNYNDGAWSNGIAKLGFGGDGEATRIASNAANSTYYFRKSFELPRGFTATNAALRFIRDDGVVIYLNGAEWGRDNMGTNAVAFTNRSATTISGTDEHAWHTYAISASALLPGTNYLAAEVHQAAANSSDVGFSFELTAAGILITNWPPAFSSDPILKPDATEDQAYTGTLADTASDPDATDVLTFTKLTGPAWLSVAANGALSGTPGNTDLGDNVFTVRVADPAGLSASATLRITVLNANDPPFFTTNPIVLAPLTVGQALAGSVAGFAGDPDPADALAFSKVSGPRWLTIAADGALAGLATTVGTNSFTIRVTDLFGASAETTLQISVLPIVSNLTLVASNAAWRYHDKGVDLGTAWRAPNYNDGAWSNGLAKLGFGNDGEVTRIASNAANSAYFFRKTFEFPAGLTVTSATLRVIRDDGLVAWLNGAYAAHENLTTNGLVFSTTATNAANETAWVTVPVNLAGLRAGTNTLAVEVHQSGPTSSDIGFNLDLRVAGTFVPNFPPEFLVNPILSVNATSGAPYSAALAGLAEDPNAGDALVFSKLTGPAWLGVAADGTLSGAPATGDVGTNRFTVRATDGAGASADASLEITVLSGEPLRLQWTFGGGSNVLSWPSGVLQEAIEVIGPWTNVPGALPPWPIVPDGPRKFYRVRE